MLLTEKVYKTRREKVVDFVIGIVIFLVFNGAMLFLSMKLRGDSFTLASCGVFILNWILIYAISRYRQWISNGMLGAFGGLLILSVVSGVILVMYCLRYSQNF